MLFDIHAGAWSDELLAVFNIPRAILPEVKDCAADFGVTDRAILGAAIPILGVAGDQQAATVGQACFQPGMLKSTYGTGCFALLNTGDKAVTSENRLLTTIAYQLGGKRTMPQTPLSGLTTRDEIPRATLAQWRLGLADDPVRHGRCLAVELPPPRLA